MKCPQCAGTHKKSKGMTCSACGYSFALNPSDKPYLSDKGFITVVDKLSGKGKYYFTFNQLYAAVLQAANDRVRKNHRNSIIACAVFSLFFVVLMSIFVNTTASAVAGIIGAVATFLVYRYTPQASYESVQQAISTYRSKHRIDFLVDGRRFKQDWSKDDLRKELYDYAPERILIVEHNDLVDMLALNRFHYDNKTIVVSADKYPEHVYKACMKFLERHPDIQVEILHDASFEGLKLRDKLIADSSWSLKDRNVVDIGLNPGDLQNIKTALWMPTGRTSPGFAPGSQDPASENIRKGMKFPVDFAPPHRMLGVLGLAVLGGLLFMSSDLLAEMTAKRGGEFGGGFG